MKKVYQASCHCNGVQFEIKLENGIENVAHCNCSMCARRSAYVIGIPVEDLAILSGQDKLTMYQWNTNTARHYFCSTCGIYTHHQRRSHPDQFGVNIACIEGVDPYSFEDVPVTDGINHSCDR